MFQAHTLWKSAEISIHSQLPWTAAYALVGLRFECVDKAYLCGELLTQDTI
jgi:hypothetical protein